MELKVKQQLFQHRGYLCVPYLSMEDIWLNLCFSKCVQMVHIYIAAWWK